MISRLVAGLLAGVLLALATATGVAAPAIAAAADECTCKPQTTANQARAADAIFTGEVISVTRDPVANNPQVFNDTYGLTVEAVYKGKLAEPETVIRTDRVFGQCSGVFVVGERVMVFAQTGEPLKVRGCAGTAKATATLVGEVEAIFGAGTSPVPPAPVEVAFSAPADQPGEPASAVRSGAPGIALVLLALAGLIVVRRLGRPAS